MNWQLGLMAVFAFAIGSFLRRVGMDKPRAVTDAQDAGQLMSYLYGKYMSWLLFVVGAVLLMFALTL